MSPKYNSLAFDETLKEFDQDEHFEPDLKVIVNAHYSKPSFAETSEDGDVIQVRGRITVSF